MVLRCGKGAAEGWGAMPHGRAAKQPLQGPGFDPSTKKKKKNTNQGEERGNEGDQLLNYHVHVLFIFAPKEPSTNCAVY